MIASLRGVTYAYPRAPAPALEDVSFDVERGDFLLLAGASGGGKSTLLRLFDGLIPQFHGGTLGGRIAVCGLDPARTPARAMASVAGIVFQEPEAQAIADMVEEEIAFGMEQHGVAPAEMRARLDGLLSELGIQHLRRRRIATLSGGERQRVAIAAVLALEPDILLLDEPTSQLDPAGAEAVIGVVRQLHGRGLTVLIAEHRLERLLPAVGGVLEVESGHVRALAPREAARELRSVPPVCELGRRLGLHPLPLAVSEFPVGESPLAVRAPAPQSFPGDDMVRLDGVTVAFGEFVALREASLSVRQGEIVALMGPNGSGKTTLFRAIAGLVALASGEIHLSGRPAPRAIQERTTVAGLVPQDPAIALYRDTVAEEIAESLRARGSDASAAAVLRVLEGWNVPGLAERHPRDISVGQQERAAIAAMLAHEPPLWLLDEPTRGADGPARAWLADRLRSHAAAGGAAIVSTHDVESAACYATRVVGLDAGRVAFDLPARQAFAASGPVPTQIARLVPGAIVLEDLS